MQNTRIPQNRLKGLYELFIKSYMCDLSVQKYSKNLKVIIYEKNGTNNSMKSVPCTAKRTDKLQ